MYSFLSLFLSLCRYFKFSSYLIQNIYTKTGQKENCDLNLMWYNGGILSSAHRHGKTIGRKFVVKDYLYLVNLCVSLCVCLSVHSICVRGVIQMENCSTKALYFRCLKAFENWKDASLYVCAYTYILSLHCFSDFCVICVCVWVDIRVVLLERRKKGMKRENIRMDFHPLKIQFNFNIDYYTSTWMVPISIELAFLFTIDMII